MSKSIYVVSKVTEVDNLLPIKSNELPTQKYLSISGAYSTLSKAFEAVDEKISGHVCGIRKGSKNVFPMTYDKLLYHMRSGYAQVVTDEYKDNTFTLQKIPVNTALRLG